MILTMEATLQVQRTLCGRVTVSEGGKHSRIIRPFFVCLSQKRCHSSSQPSFPRARISFQTIATSDYSRRRPRKSSAKTRGSSPKRFMPKTQIGLKNQKPGQNDNDGKESFVSSSSDKYKKNDDTAKLVNTDISSESDLLGTRELRRELLGNTEERLDVIEDKIDGSLLTIEEDSSGKHFFSAKVLTKTKVDIALVPENETSPRETALSKTVYNTTKKKTTEKMMKKSVDIEDRMDGMTLPKKITIVNEDDGTPRKDPIVGIDGRETGFARDTKLEEVETSLEEDLVTEEFLTEQKLEMEAQTLQLIGKIAKEKSEQGDKIFTYPQVVTPGKDVKLFLNKEKSRLKDQNNVLIKGAFNDWKWQRFTKELQKTELGGNWWSCEIHVPEQAYNVDFVFFNGEDVYENNDAKDFCLIVEGGMDPLAFEDFIIEEKRRELEKIAAEQSEKRKQAEEQRRLEAEKASIEADKAQAKVENDKRREALNQMMTKAVSSLDNVWYIQPSNIKDEETIILYYNKKSGPLIHAHEVWIHAGYNNWNDGLTIVQKLSQFAEKDGDWWCAEVTIPNCALILDWVFADGPPDNAKTYDNNKYQDFHAVISTSLHDEQYWSVEEQKIYNRLREERRQRQEAILVKAEKTAKFKAESKRKTMKMFLLSQKHIVYTEPLDVQAGDTVTIFYNPSNTVLNGKSEVWLRCSFNRWTHRLGILPPQKMMRAQNSTHVKATVKVPLDAYMMDFVFSEKETGGIFDNKNGMDYHIPVSGGVFKEPPMHIVHVALEMAPIAKVGGLGDVVTSLSRAVQDLGHNVEVIVPKYDCMNLNNVKDFKYSRSFHWGGTEIKVWFGKVEGLSVYFLEPQNGMFWVGCIYGCRNDGERFSFFCHAALEFLLQSGSRPDILHCHDWSSAPVAWLFKDHYMQYDLSNARIVFTIHNLEFGTQQIAKAMAYSHKATTVSPNYSREISRNPAISLHLDKFHGILNGIDPDIWDPYNDTFIPMSYTSENVVEGKKAAKEALQQRLGLQRSDGPLVGIITRLTVQKGIHLIKHAVWRTLECKGQVVLLGSAPDPRIQNDFVNLANHLHSSHAGQARLCLTYDEPLSHLIYAGSDFILVPSIFEPCGLTQLIAMRYGSIPIVRKTGGLYDTVFDVDNDKHRAQAQGLEPNGFNFDGADSGGVDYALHRAFCAYKDGRDWLNSLCKRVMDQDWSWNRPALDYIELYHSARKY